jgi:uncharacterized membrane protein YedE/YeeE
MREVTALFCGLLFGIGLAMSGMTDTAKVQGFLDVFGEWIPDLALVMGGAVAVTVIAFRLVLRRERPVLGGRLSLPGTTVIDGRLLGGAAVFGVGWGLYGYCPGPALSALVYLDWRTAVFFVTMLVGMAVANRITQATP